MCPNKSMDEALTLPSEKAALIALRTQQVIAHESGVANSVDPLGGSFIVETLTNQIEEGVYEYFDMIDSQGGVIAGIENGFFQREIAEAVYRYQREIEIRDSIIVRINEFELDDPVAIPIL